MQEEIEQFLGERNPDHRYASWDYCYLHFKVNAGKLSDDMEKSCAILGFYLASWGMLRGSSHLLGRSYRHYRQFVEYVDRLHYEDPGFALLDVPQYNDAATRQSIIDKFARVSELIDGEDDENSLTRTTKVMLGVWGNVPAFDRFFRSALEHDLHGRGYARLTDRALQAVFALYSMSPETQEYLDNAEYNVMNFFGEPTNLCYPIAKLIDMYGFIKGRTLEE